MGGEQKVIPRKQRCSIIRCSTATEFLLAHSLLGSLTKLSRALNLYLTSRSQTPNSLRKECLLSTYSVSDYLLKQSVTIYKE